MKKILSVLLTLAIVLGLCACGGGEGGSSDSKTGLQVGFARKSILPDIQGVEIAGGDASSRKSEGYIDQVAATCIAISEGDETILLYTIDFIVVDKWVYAAQEQISQATGVPVENILLNCTHTHSGVSIRSEWDGVDAYRIKYNKAAADAGVAAIADLSSAEMYFGNTMTTDITFVRHYLLDNGTTYGNGHGSTTNTQIKEHLYKADGELQVIKFARPAEDKKDVVLMNLGSHATIVNGTNRNSISADWPGAARAYVEANTDSLCAVFEAAAGDQIPGSKIPGAAKYSNKHPETGNYIGEHCVSVLNGEMTKASGTGINLVKHDYTANSMKEGTEDPNLLAQAQEIKALGAQYGSSHELVAAAVAKSDFHNYYEATGLTTRASAPATRSMELHAMDIHGVSFIFAPFEMFGVTGRTIKDESPYDMTFVITCSENADNYHMGYLPHLYGCEENFYEYDVTKFARGTAEDLAKTYVKILTDLKNAS